MSPSTVQACPLHLLCHGSDASLALPEGLPIIELLTVHHIGSFDPRDKGGRGESYEGVGLSVSLHPDAWMAIARLGGLPEWSLTAPDGGGRFLDVHALTVPQRGEIESWAQATDLTRNEPRWEVSWVDAEVSHEEQDENGDDAISPNKRWSLYPSQALADAEFDDQDG